MENRKIVAWHKFKKLKSSLLFQGLSWFAVFLLVEFCALMVSFSLVVSTEVKAQKLEAAREANQLTANLTDSAIETEKLLGRYFRHPSSESKAKLTERFSSFDTPLTKLEAHYAGSPEALSTLRKLRSMRNAVIAKLEELERSSASGGLLDTSITFGRYDASFLKLGQAMQDDLQKFVVRQANEQQVLKLDESKSRQSIRLAILAVSIGNICLALVLTVLFVRGVTTRLSRILSNIDRFERQMPVHDLLAGEDELALLDKKFHEMTEAITVSRHRERAVLENTTDVILSFDVNGFITAVNRAAESNWGYRMDDLLDKQVVDLIDNEDQKNFVETVRLARQKREPKVFEGKTLTVSNQLLDTLWSFNWGDDEDSMFCVVHDISERKANERLVLDSERRIRAIIEAIPIGLAVVERNGKILFLNDKLLSMLRRDISALAQLTFYDLIDTRIDLEAVSTISNTSYRNDDNRYISGEQVQAHLRRADESLLPVEISTDIALLSSGEAVLCTIIDISERLKIQDLRRQFLQMVTHDLRTPLTSVKGYFQLLEAGAYGKQNDNSIRASSRAVRNLTEVIDLVSDLLDVDKMDSGAMILAQSVTTIESLFREVQEKISGLAASKNITMRYELTDFPIEVDVSLLLRVLINLVGNAIKFSPSGSTVVLQSQNFGHEARFEVIDRGCGIPLAEQEYVFDLFHQAHSSESGGMKGSGLGLAICKRVVEAHGGAIGVQSAAGEGSIFWFTIPLTKAKDSK